MAWTAPSTAVANTRLLASVYNTQIRDNMLLTEAGIAPSVEIDTDGFGTFYFVGNGTNTIVARRTNSVSVHGVAEKTTSTTYTSTLTRSGGAGHYGPSVTIVTGTQALVFATAEIGNDTATAYAAASWSISGATTVAASDVWAMEADGLGAVQDTRRAVYQRVTGLTAGTNTFTMQYRQSGGTGRFQKRHLVVMAL